MPADTIVQFYEFTEIVRDLGATLTSVAFLGQVAERQISRLLQSKYCRLFVLDAVGCRHPSFFFLMRPTCTVTSMCWCVVAGGGNSLLMLQ